MPAFAARGGCEQAVLSLHGRRVVMQASLFVGAAVCELCACFTFWTWARRSRSAVWIVAGGACLLLFGYALSFADGATAGRATVGYLGVYVFAGFAWAWLFEGFRPKDWSAGEAGLCLIGVGMVASAIAFP